MKSLLNKGLLLGSVLAVVCACRSTKSGDHEEEGGCQATMSSMDKNAPSPSSDSSPGAVKAFAVPTPQAVEKDQLVAPNQVQPAAEQRMQPTVNTAVRSQEQTPASTRQTETTSQSVSGSGRATQEMQASAKKETAAPLK